MSCFGPFYPPRLQASVNHAELLCTVLLRAEEAAARHGRHPPAWLIGRAGELEQVVVTTIQHWREGRRSPESAAGRLDEHLDCLHDGLAAWLGLTSPPCCRAASAVTETPDAASDDQAALLDSIDRLLANLDPHQHDRV